jgi:hypothetical protein
MTVFDIYVNDRKVCRAGVGRNGVLTTMINWVNLTRPADPIAHGPWQATEGAQLQVSGLSGDTHHVWTERQLQTGDRVSVTLAKGRAADVPAQSRRRNPAQEKRQLRAYYQQLKQHFEPARSETGFLNVDLDLWSGTSLDPLLAAFGRKAVVLHAGWDGRSFRARLELASEGNSPDAVLRRFARLVERLPRRARAMWNRASVREFNVGIQAGEGPHSFDFKLEPATVRAVARIDAQIGMTVYGATVR